MLAVCDKATGRVAVVTIPDFHNRLGATGAPVTARPGELDGKGEKGRRTFVLRLYEPWPLLILLSV